MISGSAFVGVHQTLTCFGLFASDMSRAKGLHLEGLNHLAGQCVNARIDAAEHLFASLWRKGRGQAQAKQDAANQTLVSSERCYLCEFKGLRQRREAIGFGTIGVGPCRPPESAGRAAKHSQLQLARRLTWE